jgi:hypothetical protein
LPEDKNELKISFETLEEFSYFFTDKDFHPFNNDYFNLNNSDKLERLEKLSVEQIAKIIFN